MSDEVMLKEAIDATRKGQRKRARDLFTRLLQKDQSNLDYWLWMSGVVDTAKERTYCLQRVLQLDPDNLVARKGLVLIGALEPGDSIRPVPIKRRDWQLELEEEPPTGIRGIFANRALRTAVYVGAAFIVVALVLSVVLWPRARQISLARRATRTPGPAPTYTPTPTYIGFGEEVEPTAVLIFDGVPPLWTLLEATYTPTPLYVSTPHPVSEAYRAAEHAFHDGEWEKALGFYQQALQIEPGAADIYYYMAETYRNMGDPSRALSAYETAVESDPAFGAAYLERIRTTLLQEPQADIIEELNLALQYDPLLAEGYFERIRYSLAMGDIDTARSDLDQVADLAAHSPWLYIYRAQMYLHDGKTTHAYVAARQAIRMDITLLPAYFTLGQTAFESRNYEAAVTAFDTYHKYIEDNPLSWLYLGRAYQAVENDELALEAYDQALTLDAELRDVYYYRGMLYLDRGEGQQAVNDLLIARRSYPDSFHMRIVFGRSLIAAERFQDGIDTLSGAEELITNDAERAEYLYWRSFALVKLDDAPRALESLQELLDAVDFEITDEWRSKADELLALLITPTPSLSPTITPTIRSSATVTPSPAPSLTPTLVPTAAETS